MNTNILYFRADWCTPCKAVAPVIDDIAKTQKDIFIQKIDIDQEETLVEKYNVMSIPTVLLIKDGKEVKRFVGSGVTKTEILNLILTNS